jgi:hypothetical protein
VGNGLKSARRRRSEPQLLAALRDFWSTLCLKIPEICQPRRQEVAMKRPCIVSCSLILSLSVGIFAQHPAEHARTKIKLTAVVDDIQEHVPGGSCKAQTVYVLATADGQSYTLRVGPKWFLDNLSATFAKGDKLQVTGWKVDKEATADAKDTTTDVVVRQIKRGDWALDPRGDDGSANWSWMPAPKDAGKCI